MCPVALAKRRPSVSSTTELSKLWILLVGVNQYQDPTIPSLQYSALDCQGLGEALKQATEAFPAKDVRIHHDFANQRPKLQVIRNSWQEIVSAAKPQDTVLFYFSGHGFYDPSSQQVVLCLSDTHKDKLLETGFGLKELLHWLGNCAASQQLVWLDACHSGGMTLRGNMGKDTRTSLSNPTPELVKVLRQKASKSQGFYALLSCDRTQQSWEFPELGHGVFTYYLMRGLRGEAADAQGIIEADALYQYVYHQTLRYIDKTNQQIRLINQQKSGRGENQLLGEYPLQTPKRIVEGFGKVILGKRSLANSSYYYRQALVIDGASNNEITLSFSKVLGNKGGFNLEYLPRPNREWSQVREAIQATLNSQLVDEMTTALLYLRARVEETNEGEAWLVFREGVRISRSWLRQALRRSNVAQQIVILDCPGAPNLADWVDDLKLESERGQCLIAAAATVKVPEEFSTALLKTLKQADPQMGLPVAAWISQLQGYLAETKIRPEIWLSAAKGVIEVLPGRSEPKHSDDSSIFDLKLCPYMGLKAFTEENAQYFYGRELLTQRLLEQIIHNPTLAVVGASGSGKSSVVRAGLLAQLRQGKQVPGSERWWIGCMRPGVNPIEALLRVLVDSGSEKEKVYEQMQLEDLLYQGVEGFVQWLRTRPEPMVVLAIDQFEEIFTLACASDRRLFLNLLLEAVKYAADRFKLVLTLRADFISSCLEIPELATILQRSSVLIPPYLMEEDYRQAIVKPAKQVGLKVEPGLVEILLKELDRAAGDLPLLQFVLEKLWEDRQSGVLTVKTYQNLGGIRGALERQAQSVYDSLDPEAQDCARWIFLNLTQLGEGTEDTRRRIGLKDLIVNKYPKKLIDRTLQALTAAKIVVVNIEQGFSGGARGEAVQPPKPEDWVAEKLKDRTTVEIVHEILIRHWSTLRWWLEENRARLRAQRQIEQSAQLWKNHDHQSEFLLRGIRLAEAEELLLKHTDELSELAINFIGACIKAKEEEKKETARRLRRAQAAAAAIGFLGVAAFGLAGLAYRQKLLAQVQEIDALDSSSEALSFSKRPLESAIASVKAGEKLNQIGGSLGQKLIGSDRWTKTRLKTVVTLQQATYGTQELNRLEKHTQRINAVNYSPDGQILASASDDNTVMLWRKDGTLLSTLEGHTERVTSLAFSPDGQYLASASADRTVKIWQLNREDLSQTQLIQTLSGHQDWVSCVAFSPDGQYLASASRDRSVKLWRLDGSLVSTITDSGWINAISFSADGKLLASGGEDNLVKLWRINGQNQLESKPWQTLKGHGDRLTSIAFSPDGKQLVSASEDNSVKLWQTADGKLLNSFLYRDRVNSVKFSPKGDAIAAAGADSIVTILGIDGSLRQSLFGHGGEIFSLSFSPDGKAIASASTDKTVRLWRIVGQPKEQEAGTSRVRFSPKESKLFATAGFDGKIKLWQYTEGNSRKLVKTLPGHKMTVGDIQFSPDGKILVSAGWDKAIKIWRVEDGAELATLTQHQDGVTSLAFSPDGTMFASGSDDNTVMLWKIKDGEAELVNTLQGHQDGVISLAFSPDGKYVASGSYDKAIKIWRVDDGSLVSTLNKQGLAIAALKFSADGKTLASASYDNTIQLWRIVDLGHDRVEPFKTLAGHQGGVTGLDFAHDGKVIASSSDDGTIKFWDVRDGMLITTLFGHTSKVLDLNFNLSDRTLVSTEEQAGLFVWNLESDDLLKRACQNLKDYLKTNPNVSEGDAKICF